MNRRKMRSFLKVRLAVAGAALLGGAAGATADTFTPNSIFVLRLGNGTNTGITTDASAQPVFIDRFSLSNPAAGSTQFTSFASTTGQTLTIGGVDDHDGILHLSTDGSVLTLGGYRAAAGTASVSTTAAATVNRVIGTVSPAGTSGASTALTDAYNAESIRAVTTDNGQRFWTAGAGAAGDATGGFRYAAAGATTSTNLNTNANAGGSTDWRNIQFAGSQLYLDTGSSGLGNKGAYAPSDPKPVPTTSGPDQQTITAKLTVASSSDKLVPKSDAVFLSLGGNGIDTAYTTGGQDDYEKWTLSNGVWTRVQAKELSNTSLSINALDAYYDGTTVQLFATTDGAIFKLTDSAASGSAIVGTETQIATAAAGEEFRGIVVVAAPEPATAAILLFGAMPLLRRRRAAGVNA